MAKVIRGGTSPPHFCHKKEVKIMTGTTKAIWGAAALVTGVTILTGVMVHEAIIEEINDKMYYYKYGRYPKDIIKMQKKVDMIREREERR